MRKPRKPSPREPGARSGPAMRAQSPDDLLGVVPYLLGFHPTDSVVLILLGQRDVMMTARIDAAALADPHDLASYLDQVRSSQGALGMVIITYSQQAEARESTLALAAALDPAFLVDALLADGSRWWSILCDGPCCPAEGTPYDEGSNPLSATAVYAGLSALPDRAAVESLVAGPPTEEEPALLDLAETAVQQLCCRSLASRRRLVRTLVRDAVQDRPRPADRPGLSDADCIRLAVLVHDLQVRDVAWAQLRRERAGDHVALWQQVVSRTPPGLAAAPLCLLGMAAWVAGNGALQNCCVERVEQIDPSYTMASLLSDINRRAIPPRCWDELLAEFRRHPDMLAG